MENSTEPESYYPHEKVERYISEAKEAEAKGDKVKLEAVKKEGNLLNRIAVFQAGRMPDVWGWCMLNLNKPFPEWNKEDIDYYAKRYDETRDLMERARYAYVLWVFRKEFKLAESCISDLQSAGELYHSKGWYKQYDRFLTMTFCFEFAARLSLSLDVKAPNDAVSILMKIRPIILSMHSQKEMGRGISDLIEVVARLSEDLRNNRELRENRDVISVFSDVLRVSDEIADKWQQKKEYHWYRSYLNYSVQLNRFLGKPDDAKRIRLKIAEAYQEESGPATSEIVRSHLLQRALETYSEEGESKKIEEINRKIRDSTAEMLKKDELKEIKVGPVILDIPKWAAQHVRAYAGMTPEEILRRIVGNKRRFPDKERVRKLVEELKRDYAITFVVQHVVIGRDLPEETLTNEKDIFEFKVSRQFSLESQINEYVQAGILNELFLTLVHPDDLKSFLNTSKNITPNSMKLVEIGIDYHFKKEYFPSIHILIPQIEEILRKILLNKGKPGAKYMPGDEGLQEKLLGGLLDDMEGIADSNFVEYLRVRLTKKGAGSNIRNKVCHGWMESDQFTDTLSWMLIDIILRLSTL